MSEEVKEPVKKKGGKLPIIIAVVVLLAGGGFFMTKSKGGGKKEKPAVELGEIQTMPEFLVNLKDNSSYLRTEIALQTAKTVEKEKFDKMTPAIRDAIITTLTSKSIEDIRSIEGKDKLKKELAKAINEACDDADEKDESADKKDDSDKSDDKKKKVIDVHIHTDWDSQTGPILKVFFTSFATQ